MVIPTQEVCMEKLSSILPSNARIRSVDLKASQASRPGTPNFGQRIGTTAATQEKIDLGRAAELGRQAMDDTLAIRNPKEAEHRRIAEETTRNFFETRLRTEPRETEVDDLLSPEIPRTGVNVGAALGGKVKAPEVEETMENSRSLDLYA